jgi:hypothetical protein
VIYDFRCQECGYEKSLERDTDPGTIACPECGTGDDVRWWCKRPSTPFVPPASASQKFGPHPWEYVATPEELAERERVLRERAPIQLVHAIKVKEPEPEPQLTLLELLK